MTKKIINGFYIWLAAAVIVLIANSQAAYSPATAANLILILAMVFPIFFGWISDLILFGPYFILQIIAAIMSKQAIVFGDAFILMLVAGGYYCIYKLLWPKIADKFRKLPFWIQIALPAVIVFATAMLCILLFAFVNWLGADSSMRSMMKLSDVFDQVSSTGDVLAKLFFVTPCVVAAFYFFLAADKLGTKQVLFPPFFVKEN